jgi:hypothetical protein
MRSESSPESRQYGSRAKPHTQINDQIEIGLVL